MRVGSLVRFEKLDALIADIDSWSRKARNPGSHFHPAKHQKVQCQKVQHSILRVTIDRANPSDSRDRREPPFCQESVNRLFHPLSPFPKL